MTGRAFFRTDGAPEAFAAAAARAGPGGRVATMVDVAEARIASPPRDFAWTRYFTTASSEFVGRSRGGTALLAVLHGTGPLSDADGIERAYAAHGRDDPGGRVPLATFHEILDGLHGRPHVVELEAWLAGREYPFSFVRASEAAEDVLVRARLGGADVAARYVASHAAIDAARGGGGAILSLGEPGTANYAVPGLEGATILHSAAEPPEGFAYAHLLSVGQVVLVRSWEYADSIQCDLGVHDRYDGVRVLGLTAGHVPGQDLSEAESAAARAGRNTG